MNEIFARHLEDKIEDVTEFEFSHLQKMELHYLGFNLSYDIFINLEPLQRSFQAGYLNQKTGRAIGAFEDSKQIMTKKNEPMLVGKFKDSFSVLNVVIFPTEYKRLQFEIKENKLYCIDYTIRLDEKTKKEQLIIKNVIEC